MRLEGIPTFFATGRTRGRSPGLTNSRVAFDNSRPCFSSKGVEKQEIKAKGVVIASNECSSVM